MLRVLRLERIPSIFTSEDHHHLLLLLLPFLVLVLVLVLVLLSSVRGLNGSVLGVLHVKRIPLDCRE